MIDSLLHEVYAVKTQTSLAPLSRFRGSCVTTTHAHQCCRFQSYAKTVPSQMKLTKHEPTFLGSTTTDHGVWRLTLTAYYSSMWMIIYMYNLHYSKYQQRTGSASGNELYALDLSYFCVLLKFTCPRTIFCENLQENNKVLEMVMSYWACAFLREEWWVSCSPKYFLSFDITCIIFVFLKVSLRRTKSVEFWDI